MDVRVGVDHQREAFRSMLGVDCAREEETVGRVWMLNTELNGRLKTDRADWRWADEKTRKVGEECSGTICPREGSRAGSSSGSEMLPQGGVCRAKNVTAGVAIDKLRPELMLAKGKGEWLSTTEWSWEWVRTIHAAKIIAHVSKVRCCMRIGRIGILCVSHLYSNVRLYKKAYWFQYHFA